MKTMHIFKILSVLLLLGTSTHINAALIKYDFFGELNDGGLVNGSFIIDTDTFIITDALLTSSGGSLVGPKTFSLQESAFGSGFNLLDPTDGPDFSNNLIMVVFIDGSWSDSNLSPDVLTNAQVSEFRICINADCSIGGAQRAFFVSASLSGELVPVSAPTSLLLFISAIFGLWISTRLRRVAPPRTLSLEFLKTRLWNLKKPEKPIFS